jgi:hypothetical protein
MRIAETIDAFYGESGAAQDGTTRPSYVTNDIY